MEKRGKHLKVISLFQIILMISFVFSFSFILGSGFKVVSAQEQSCSLAPELCEQKQSATPHGTNIIPDETSGGEDEDTEDDTTEGGNGDICSKDFLGLCKEEDKCTGQGGFWYGGICNDIPKFPLLGPIFESFKHALFVVAAIQLLGPLFGISEENTNALSKSAAVGIISKGIAEGIGQKFPDSPIAKFLGDNSAWVGFGIGVLVFVLTYKREKQETITFSCLPWQAPTGGGDCEKCNSKDFPCSEYQCRSLGQSCELINKGTQEEKCVWINRNDVNPPIIQAWQDALLNDYKYAPDNAVSPPDRGVKILYEKSPDNCVPAFTPLRFGVTLNEPAICKLDILRKDNFNDMALFMSSSLARYNHSYALSLPSAEALLSENISIQNDGNFELYVRCQDSNGNSNTANFQFRYCVDQGPDTTPPLIVTTSLLNNVPIAFNQSSIDLEVYINEPAECRWDHNDRAYESMEQSMSCSTNVFEFNAQMLYKCSTTLTGLKDRTENNFYFRCKDKPGFQESERNENIESYKFTLIGTRPLVIDSVEPNDEVIKDSTTPIKVTIKALTSSGYKEGESICYYSDSGNDNDYIKFFNTNSFEHSQELFLSEGEYEYFIRCIDLGGNADTNKINFAVETDLTSPLVVRVYKEDNFLKLITNEKAECVYSTFGCNYEFTEGTQINVIDENNHFTNWNINLNLYVKCQDDFGNQPLPNQCSIVVKASDF